MNLKHINSLTKIISNSPIEYGQKFKNKKINDVSINVLSKYLSNMSPTYRNDNFYSLCNNVKFLKKYIKKTKNNNDNLVAIFDLETNGLIFNNNKENVGGYNKKICPVCRNTDIYELDHKCCVPEILSLSFLLYDMSTEKIVKEYDFFISPDNYENYSHNLEAETVHGITEEYLKTNGTSLETCLKFLLEQFTECNIVFAYNSLFDEMIVRAYAKKYNFVVNNNIYFLCAMKMLISYYNGNEKYKTTNSIGVYYKFPKLEQVYADFFNETFNAHNSLDDIKATCRVMTYFLNNYEKYIK